MPDQVINTRRGAFRKGASVRPDHSPVGSAPADLARGLALIVERHKKPERSFPEPVQRVGDGMAWLLNAWKIMVNSAGDITSRWFRGSKPSPVLAAEGEALEQVGRALTADLHAPASGAILIDATLASIMWQNCGGTASCAVGPTSKTVTCQPFRAGCP
jgi:hypothetical protein